MTALDLQKRLLALADPERAQASARYFKTGPGESGEGLRFLGLDAASVRGLAKEFRALPLAEVEATLQSDWHDERAVALVVLTLQYPKADAAAQKAIYELYLANTSQVNSWALVDCSAPQIVGAHLWPRSRKPLGRLAKSKSLWERRIAIVATQHFIRKGDFADTLRVAERLLNDDQDLIHKAAGWMLREVGERDTAVLEQFLKQHYRAMPRTMLRYAIEKFPPKKRKAYLNGDV
ncbi:MAG: DNA alkylation repair protein [Planctomycetes bacterium]|nr:DNA alkylation repair protein [Planctomycetota bacterium]